MLYNSAKGNILCRMYSSVTFEETLVSCYFKTKVYFVYYGNVKPCISMFIIHAYLFLFRMSRSECEKQDHLHVMKPSVIVGL